MPVHWRCKSLETDRTFNKPGMTVSFLRLYELDEDLEDFQIDHPVEVTTEQVRNHLLSIFIRIFPGLIKGPYLFSP